ncbi:hypothetical protein [Bacillus thuringiensis]|uniref:hypothetical protein n=1 Tax=Bacillus thuringiensis TaxID=1428 RepID=UPI003339701E
MTVSEGLLQGIHTYMKKSLSKQVITDRTIKRNTKQLAELTESVEEVKQQAKEVISSYVAKKIIRDQLQQERHAKAKGFVGNKVQLSFEAMEGTKSDLEHHVQVLIKKEVTRVMRHITSYLKEQLGLKSIDDIPNCLVEKHKTLLKELTWKKLDTFMKKGSR